MKKIFSIILIFVIIFLHITVYAEYKLRYEELPQTESILAPDIEMNEKNWIFSVIKEDQKTKEEKKCLKKEKNF